MKRFLSCLFIVFVVSALLCGYALADGTPTLSVSDGGEAEPGEEVTLTVDISDNPGIAAFTMNVTYDEDRLELNKVKHTGMGGGTWLVNEDSVGWFAFHDYDYDGELLTLSFTVKEDAPNGEAAVSIGYTDGNIGNFDEETVHFDVEAGGVTVSGGAEAPAAEEEDSAEDVDETADSEENSASPVSDNSNTGTDDTTSKTSDSGRNVVVGGDSQSGVQEVTDASVTVDNVLDSERNSTEDDTDDAIDINPDLLVEDSVLPAEDAGEETGAQVDEAQNEENQEGKLRVGSVPTVAAKSHSLLWLWIALVVLLLVLAAVVLYLFVFKKDKGRH